MATINREMLARAGQDQHLLQTKPEDCKDDLHEAIVFLEPRAGQLKIMGRTPGVVYFVTRDLAHHYIADGRARAATAPERADGQKLIASMRKQTDGNETPVDKQVRAERESARKSA